MLGTVKLYVFETSPNSRRSRQPIPAKIYKELNAMSIGVIFNRQPFLYGNACDKNAPMMRHHITDK